MTTQESTGRYFVRTPEGRTFCVEPIKERVERALDWTNGGIQKPTGGAVPEGESIITPENGFINIRVAGNPMDAINTLLKEGATMK